MKKLANEAIYDIYSKEYPNLVGLIDQLVKQRIKPHIIAKMLGNHNPFNLSVKHHIQMVAEHLTTKL